MKFKTLLEFLRLLRYFRIYKMFIIVQNLYCVPNNDTNYIFFKGVNPIISYLLLFSCISMECYYNCELLNEANLLERIYYSNVKPHFTNILHLSYVR